MVMWSAFQRSITANITQTNFPIVVFDLVVFCQVFVWYSVAKFCAEQPSFLARNFKCAVPGAPPEGDIHGLPTSFLNNFSFWFPFLWRNNGSILRHCWFDKVLTSLCRLGSASEWRKIHTLLYTSKQKSWPQLRFWVQVKIDRLIKKIAVLPHNPCMWVIILK